MVSYQTVLTVDNDDLSLRPGMTGDRRDHHGASAQDVLLVPNAALRFTPAAAGAAQKSGGGILGAHAAAAAAPGVAAGDERRSQGRRAARLGAARRRSRRRWRSTSARPTGA